MNTQDSSNTQGNRDPADDDRRDVDTQRRQDDRSVGRLIRTLMLEVTSLVRNEAELARAEVSQKLSRLQGGIVALALAVILLLIGLIGLMDAAIYGLGTVWPLWLSALVIGGAIVIIGLIALAIGISSLKKASNLKLERTSAELRKDTAFAREQTQ